MLKKLVTKSIESNFSTIQTYDSVSKLKSYLGVDEMKREIVSDYDRNTMLAMVDMAKNAEEKKLIKGFVKDKRENRKQSCEFRWVWMNNIKGGYTQLIIYSKGDRILHHFHQK